MKLNIFIIICLSLLCVGCTSTTSELKTEDITYETTFDTTEIITFEEKITEIPIETTTEEVNDLKLISDIEVQNKLFDVVLTVPKDIIGDITQDELNKMAEENGHKSAILNNDGSVTYTMTKEQHNKLLELLRQSFDEQIKNNIINSEDYPNFIDYSVNDKFDDFKIITTANELDMNDRFVVLQLYMFGGTYAIYNGNPVDNIHIDFINNQTKEVIDSANSKDLKE